MLNWFKKKMSLLAIALASVEKNSLRQKNEGLDQNITQERRNTEGDLMDSLKQGKITKEVENRRWRIYKILKATNNVNSKIIGYDDDNMPITKTIKKDKNKELVKVKLDSHDDYPLEMVIDNTPIPYSGNDSIDNEHINLYDDSKENLTEDGDLLSVSHGEIKAEDYFSTNKTITPINITRLCLPKFEIETFAKKLNIRKVSDEVRLLEFYISMYPDVDDRKTRLLISDIKKAMINPINASFLEIKEVNFITHKSLGVEDFLEFGYDVISLDKIIEFNGHYVIKYLAKVNLDGKNILDKYIISELDDKYERKEKK
jgi:hypothetical protein